MESNVVVAFDNEGVTMLAVPSHNVLVCILTVVIQNVKRKSVK